MIKLYLNQGLLFLAAMCTVAPLIAQTECTQYDYFYADITETSSGTQTDIYSVSFEDGDANLTPIVLDLPFGAHIAFDQNTGLIYMINESNGDIRTLDPVTGEMGVDIPGAEPVGKVTTASINADGKLLIGSDSFGKIFQAETSTNPYGVSEYDTDDDISGGDLTWTNSGLFLASKPNGYLYLVLPGVLNVLQGSVAPSVTGMATMSDGENVVVSSLGNATFMEYSISGGVSEVNSYQAMLNGESFSMGNGDMTSGCMSFSDSTSGCDDFQYFYINDNGPDVATGMVMSATIIENDLVLTSLFESGISGHIAVNNDNGDFYVVRTDRVKTFTSTGDLISDVNIPGNIGKLTAAVWNPATNLVYVGSQNGNSVYELNPADGSHTLFASDLPVEGGDLILNEANELFVVERNNNGSSKLYNISTGTAELISEVAPSINGAAITADGGYIMAEGEGSQSFHLYTSSGDFVRSLNAVDNLGNPMTLVDGDMASGCLGGSNPLESSCIYSLYYTDFQNQNASQLLSLTINPDNSVTSNLLANIDYGSTSSALSSDGVLYVPNRFGQGFFTAWDVISGTQLGGEISMTTSGGDNIQNIGGATFHNGLLYVNSLNGTAYALDPATGIAQEEIVHGDDNGSDIVFDESGDLWLISREDGIFYNLTEGTSFAVDLSDIDGIALMDNGNFAAVNGDNGSTMYEVDQNAGVLTGNTYDLGFSVEYGDLSSACIDNENFETPGQCYATEVLEYIEGTTQNGGSIASDRIHADRATGEPERTDENVFVSLGYGGSITLAFDGSIPNGIGDDIEVVETTFNNNSCDTYPEFADVYLSQTGESWTFAKTICRADGMVEITSANPSWTFVNYVRIVNNNDLSNTPDAFDVDGVVAIHNCEDGEGEPPITAIESQSTISTYPSPTTGLATINILAGRTGQSNLEILDMNGRLVKQIFDKNVIAGQTYTVDFDGSDLPNGIYVTKLTTANEITVGKIMIAR